MAKALDSRQAVPLEEVVLAQAFQLEALINVLERQGVIKKAEGAGGDQGIAAEVAEGPLEALRASRKSRRS